MFFVTKRKISYRQLRQPLVLLLAVMFVLPERLECSSMRLCGFRLTMTLTALCKNQLCGGFFVPTRKRSDESLYTPISDLAEPERRTESSANRFLTFHSMSKRSGIATECCEKRCSLAYLKTFCCAGFQIPPVENSSNAGGNRGAIEPADVLI